MNTVPPSYAGLKVLVTGGLGFIGSNLARRLFELGAEVLVVDSLHPKSGGNISNLKGLEDRLNIRIVDLRNREVIEELVPGLHVVFHLAGLVSHIDSMNDPVSDLEANVHAQAVLLEACRKFAPSVKIVYASTRQVYGRPDCCPVDEKHALRPVDVNGIHKLAAEAYQSLYRQVYGMKTVSLRLTNVFGPRMRIADARQTFLGVWVRRVVEDGVFEVWGGQQKRDLCYVDDAVDAFLVAGQLAAIDGCIFNIGGCPPVTLAELAEALVRIAGKGRFEIKRFPPEFVRIDIGDYFADDSRFRSVSGWAPKISLLDGLKHTVAYYEERLSDYV
jgi:UDP-glucose 4-epimerase